MTGSAIDIKYDASDMQRVVDQVAERCGSVGPALEIIGETVTASVQRNFEVGGRPSGWQPLAEATLAAKKGGSILVGKGFGGGLLGSIHSEVEGNVVYVGTNKVYGAIHQFGGMAGRGRKVKIPARPYLRVQDEDVEEIVDELKEFVMTGREA